MAIEEHENQETSLQDLIDLVERDDLPTNEFTIEDKDPMVILGKLNEVIANLQSINNTVSSSDSKADEALTKATQAIADATQALTTANGIDAKATLALQNAVKAVENANSAIQASTQAVTSANTALTTANTAISTANSAEETAQSAETKSDNAITTANTASATATSAKNTAEGIDAKATTALSNSQTAVSTANSANATAQEALDQVIAGQGTKVYRDTQLLTSLDIKPIEDDIANNATAINNEATTRANAVNALDNAKVDKVTGKQLSTEDYTTEEKTKLAGLYNYNDTEVKADISALQNGKVDKVAGKQLSTEDFTTTEKNKLAGLSNYDDTQVQADISALQNGKVDKVTGKQLSTEDFTTTEKNKLAGLSNYDDTQVQADLSSLTSNKADKNNANQSIVAGDVTAPTGNFDNINTLLNKKLQYTDTNTIRTNFTVTGAKANTTFSMPYEADGIRILNLNGIGIINIFGEINASSQMNKGADYTLSLTIPAKYMIAVHGQGYTKVMPLAFSLLHRSSTPQNDYTNSNSQGLTSVTYSDKNGLTIKWNFKKWYDESGAKHQLSASFIIF